MWNIRSLGIIATALLAVPAYAAQMYIDTGTGSYGVYDTFYVPVRIDTQGECINAVRAVIAYNPEEITVRDVMTGDSIITLWTERPTIMRAENQEVGRVLFEGGIPGGYCGRIEGDSGLTNTLIQLVVRSVYQPAGGEVASPVRTPFIIEPGAEAYRNDGSGETVPLTTLGATVTLVQATSTPRDVWKEDLTADTVAPELFDVRLVRGPSEGNRYHYIVFSTTDKQSGIDHYEVLETDPNRFGFFPLLERPSYWVPAESPYVLRDQALHSTIRVKAVDKVGNERIVEYTPPMSPLLAYTRASFLVPVAILLGLLSVVVAFGFRMARKRVPGGNATTQEQSHEYEA